MSDDPIGYGNPPKHTQFKKGQSGNPRGRPKKRKRYLLPRQMREDVLRLMAEDLVVDTPKGRKKENAMKLFLIAVRRHAISGNPTAIRIWLTLTTNALAERMAENGPVRMLDQFLDGDNRKRARLQDFASPDWDIEDVTRDIY